MLREMSTVPQKMTTHKRLIIECCVCWRTRHKDLSSGKSGDL